MEEEKEFKDIKLGASFAYKGVIYECRFGLTCEGCVFDTGDSFPGCVKPLVLGACSGQNRHDQRAVIFVEIGKEKPAVPKTEFAIGEEFQYGLKKLRCVKSKNPTPCEGCYFEDRPCDPEEIGNCKYDSRSNGENVIFVEVKPENKEK